MEQLTVGLERCTFCVWHECSGCSPRFANSDSDVIANWLRRMESHDLRRLARGHADSAGLSLESDEDLAARLSWIIRSGALRVCGGTGARTATGGTGAAAVTPFLQTEEDRVLARLRKAAAEFSFEGLAYRIVRCDQRESIGDADRYQVVARDEAQRILGRMGASPSFAPDERTALKEAADLIPQTPAVRDDRGLLLLRRRQDSGGISEPTRSEAAAPTRSARPKIPPNAVPEPAFFPTSLDVAAMAATLKAAARMRVPLCEVCEKARAAEAKPAPLTEIVAPVPDAEFFNPDFDAMAMAAVLKVAARNASPFCEECAKARAAAVEP